MKILGKPTATLEQCNVWIKGIKTANKLAITNMPILYNAAVSNGIDPVVLIAQCMIETGYFNFGGVISASFHNTCGLKTTKGGSNYSANAHMKFDSWKDGIQAHADHLGLYAGSPKCPKYSPNTKGYYNENCKKNGTTKDPRHFTYLYGKCKTVESLEGTWATSKDYAEKILKLVKQIQGTKVANTTTSKKTYANGDYNRKAKVVANSGLNVRKGRPGSKEYNTILDVLKNGTVIEVHYCLNGWFSIYTNKANPGYISGQYIEFI